MVVPQLRRWTLLWSSQVITLSVDRGNKPGSSALEKSVIKGCFRISLLLNKRQKWRLLKHPVRNTLVFKDFSVVLQIVCHNLWHNNFLWDYISSIYLLILHRKHLYTTFKHPFTCSHCQTCCCQHWKIKVNVCLSHTWKLFYLYITIKSNKKDLSKKAKMLQCYK